MDKINLFSKNECNEIINISESLNAWGYKKSNNYSFSRCFFSLPFNLENKLINYCTNSLNLSLKEKKLSFAVLKYQSNDFFGRHMDRYDTTDFNRDFIYNINIKLNDEYTGGEFFYLDKKFNSNVGDIYHYNSTHYHEVKNIKTGIRYTGLCYIRERDLLNYNKNLI